MGEIMGLFSRKAWEPEPMTWDQMIDFLGLPPGSSLSFDLLVDESEDLERHKWRGTMAKMWMPANQFGDGQYYYRGEIINKGKAVDVKVEGKKVGQLDNRCLADAVEVFRRHGTSKVVAAVSGWRDQRTQPVIANVNP
jgi:hypothetical protein